MKIYLCGGMKGDWQDKVIAARPQHTYIDPRTHGLKDERAYTEWDLRGVRDSDLLVAVMTPDNPSGYGLNLEIGYAAALRIPVLFVCDPGQEREKYFGMARCCSLLVPSLDALIECIPND